MKVSPILQKDGYKVGHRFQYPSDTNIHLTHNMFILILHPENLVQILIM